MTVSAPQGGTYNLDVVHRGIADVAGNPLADTPRRRQTTPTPSLQTRPPRRLRRSRGDPIHVRRRCFGVTFSEGVTGVDADDFALSPDSTGAGSVQT